MRPLPPRRELERAFLSADGRYDGLFVAGVRTTGIFCRPSCRARKPDAAHLQFFPTGAAAMACGYRACRRCEPMASARTPEWVDHLLSALDERPGVGSVRRLLEDLGIEPGRARRAFRREFGMTLAVYARTRRLGRALDRLHRGARLDEVVFDTGYGSHSGFRDAFAQLTGRPPGHAGRVTRVALAWMTTPLGRLIAGATDAGICLLEFTDRPDLDRQMAALQRRLDAVAVPGAHPQLAALEHELRGYVAGTRQVFSLPLVLAGSSFEQEVWETLREIPYGETRSYEAVARRLGRPAAARAVGRATGANRVALLVPCHRVTGARGALTGYAGGVWRKRALLHLEQTGEPLEDPAGDTEPATAQAAFRMRCSGATDGPMEVTG